MPLESLICILGLVVITYFMAKPKSEPKEEDNLTDDITEILYYM